MDVQAQVSQNTEALQGAQLELNDLKRQIQTLEIELASQQSLVMLHTIKAAICDFQSVSIEFAWDDHHNHNIFEKRGGHSTSNCLHLKKEIYDFKRCRNKEV